MPNPTIHHVDWETGARNGEGSKIFPYQTLRDAVDHIRRDPLNGDCFRGTLSAPPWWIRLALRVQCRWAGWKFRRTRKWVVRGYERSPEDSAR